MVNTMSERIDERTSGENVPKKKWNPNHSMVVLKNETKAELDALRHELGLDLNIVLSYDAAVRYLINKSR